MKRRLISIAILLTCGLLLAGTVYTVVLDQQIRTRFAGSRWALPAQIYAAPTELFAGLAWSEATLLQELQRLGYRSGSADSPGQYRIAGARVDIHARSFRFWDTTDPARLIRVEFDADRVGSVRDAQGRESVERLDPLLIGSIYPKQGEDRVLVALDQVPPVLARGLVLVEDQRFYEHFGLDPRSIARAFVVNLRAGGVVQGGSTLTQQLVKNFFLTNQRSLARKAREAILSLLLEVHYGKDEILEAYLNEVYLGQDGARAVHGFGLGSQFYFRKPLAELRVQELALLVGLVKGPSYYDPRRHPERAVQRRNLVLQMWQEAGLISDADLIAARVAPLGVVETGGAGRKGYPGFVELVRAELQRDYRDHDLTHEGLRIFTTLEPHLQDIAEQEVAGGLRRLEAQRHLQGLEAAAVVTSSTDGAVLALVPGRQADFKGFNRALAAKRPVGSLLKPVVYLTALRDAHRYQLTSLLNDTAVALDLPNGTTWTPSNYDGKEHGQVPLFMALARSYNLATVNLALDVGLPAVVSELEALGFGRDVPALPSLALGAVEMSPFEVAGIYASFASGGFAPALRSIRDVQTRTGEPLKRYPLTLQPPQDAAPLFLLDWALQQVMQQGTGRGAYRTLDASVRTAGKTGTTDSYRDSWFAGYGGNFVGTVWVGRDDNQSTGLTGSTGALPIWAAIMDRAGLSDVDRPQPPSIEWARVDIDSYRPAPSGCRSILRVPFAAGTVPEVLAPCADEAEPHRFRFRDLWR